MLMKWVEPILICRFMNKGSLSDFDLHYALEEECSSENKISQREGMCELAWSNVVENGCNVHTLPTKYILILCLSRINFLS